MIIIRAQFSTFWKESKPNCLKWRISLRKCWFNFYNTTPFATCNVQLCLTSVQSVASSFRRQLLVLRQACHTRSHADQSNPTADSSTFATRPRLPNIPTAIGILLTLIEHGEVLILDQIGIGEGRLTHLAFQFHIDGADTSSEDGNSLENVHF